MTKLTEEQIKDINDQCPYDQGIFKEPFGIPDNIKEHVIYTKWDSRGRDGSCWDDEDTINEDYEFDRPDDAFKVLDITLAILRPNTNYLLYEQIKSLIESNKETDYGYYGNYTTDTIEWIKLSDLYRILNID